MAYKPDGYTSVAPYLVLADPQKTLDFLNAVFGCEPLRLYRRDDGSIMHAEVRIDDTVVMLGQQSGGPEAHLHVYVPDVDAVFDRAVEAGASLIAPLETKDDGDRRGGVRDPGGTAWWFATRTGNA
ncbi:MAG: VOC family protein [Beijerinckiaceae bacterium]